MRRSHDRERTSNWVLNAVMITLFSVSVLYMALYWWPHSQGRSSPLDKYAPAGRAFLAKLGWAPKTASNMQGADGKSARQPVSGGIIRNAILGNAEWISYDELDQVETSGRNATVVIRARMTNDEALATSREVFDICFSKVANLMVLRVITRVKGRSAAGSGRFVDSVRTDITMSRGTFSNLNWPTVTPNRLPKVADRAKLYF